MIFDPNKILVTGGFGLVGSCVTGNHKPRSSEVNLMKFDEINSYLRLNKIDCVVHCAARVGGVKENSEKLGEFFYENMQMNLNLLEACRINNIKKIVSILTTCIFPAAANYPLTYNQLHNGEPHKSNYGYAYAKRMLEINSRAYRDQYGMNIINVIPCNVYGPRDNFSINTGHVIPALINKAFLAQKHRTPLRVWGDGSALREFIYSEDLGKIIDWVVNNYSLPEPLIISPDEEISIKSIAEGLMRLYHIPKLIFESDMPMGQLRKPSDNSKLKSMLNFEFVPFDVGLEKTVSWFNANYRSARK